MNAAHTPGSWQVIRERDRISGEQRLFIGLKGLTVAEIPPGLPKTEEDANAQLIASAPQLLAQRNELLEALKSLTERAGHVADYDLRGHTRTVWTDKQSISPPGSVANAHALREALTLARNAIAKATP